MLDAYMHGYRASSFENFSVVDMVTQLNALYRKQARTERYEVTKQLWECKMAEGSSLSEHMIKRTEAECSGICDPYDTRH